MVCIIMIIIIVTTDNHVIQEVKGLTEKLCTSSDENLFNQNFWFQTAMVIELRFFMKKVKMKMKMKKKMKNL